MAGCALAALFFDQEKAAEDYFAATKKDQAKIGFDRTRTRTRSRTRTLTHARARAHIATGTSTSTGAAR